MRCLRTSTVVDLRFQTRREIGHIVSLSLSLRYKNPYSLRCGAMTKGTLSQDCKLVRKRVYVNLYKIF